jgi:excisionase family DNA binding protein
VTAPADEPSLLTPGEVAQLLRVDPKTVTRWAKEGRLPPAFVTPGGHRRYRLEDVEALVRARGAAPAP